MNKFNYSLLLFISIFVMGCSGSSNSNNPQTNTEKAYQKTLKQNVDAYCSCMSSYVKYIDSKENTEEAKTSRMGKEMMKQAQTCVQRSDKDNNDVQLLSTELSLIDRQMYNSQFRKRFDKQCPNEAKVLVGIWGNVGPLPTN